MKTNIRLLGAAAIAPLVLACATGAAAQSIDYGSLQELFNEPVTTSATGSPQRSTDVPVDMDIISAADIKRSGATDIPTILSRVAGLDVLQWTGFGADVAVRGYGVAMTPRLLVLINGRQVYLDHYGYMAWSTLPVQLSEIRQIEVVKGPNAALFGFNAVGGVVNIITYNPKFDDVDNGSLTIGTQSYGGVSLVQTAKLGENIFARLSVGASQQDEWDNTVGIESQLLTDPAKVSVNLDTITQLNDKTEFRLEGAWSNVKQSDQLTIYEFTPSKYLTTGVKGTLTTDSKLGLLQLSAYQNDLSVKYIIGDQFSNYNNTTTVLSAQDLFKVGSSHTFRLGGEYRHNEVNTAPDPGGKIIYNIWSASGMWNWAVNEKLSLMAALRYDNLELSREGTFPSYYLVRDNAAWGRSIAQTSYNLGAVYKPTQLDAIRLTAARGAQLPSLIDFGGLGLTLRPAPVITIIVIGNPNLEPTVVTNYGLAYERSLPSIEGKIAIRGFVQKTEDLKGQPAATMLDSPPIPVVRAGVSTYRNVGDAELKGFEVLANGKLAGGYRWSADYTFTDIENQPDPGFNYQARLVDYAANTPTHRGNVAFGWSDAKWSADGYLHYVSEFGAYLPNRSPVKIDGYVTLAGRVARQFGEDGPTIAVSGQNLLNERQDQTGGLEAERRLLLTISKNW